MQPYLLLHILVLAGWLLAVQHACKHQQYWVKPSDSDNDSCECTSASKQLNTISSTMHRCATLNQYAVCLNNGTCKKNIMSSMKDKCITLIFLPGKHNLTTNLHVSKRVSLVMVKEPKCCGSVEIHLDKAGVTLSCIAQLTLADFNDNSEYHNNLTLMNVPHTCAKYSILKPSYIMRINRLEHIMLFFLPIILFRNSSYFNLLFPYYHPIILMNLFKKIESMHKINDVAQL